MNARPNVQSNAKPSAAATMTSPAPVTTAAEAEKLTAHFIGVIDALVDIVQRETDVVRAGRLDQVAAFEKPKGALAGLYIADTLRLRASQTHLSRILPAEKREALSRRHEAFRSLLQVNLTVLATAHTVSEGIIRGLSREMARKSAPQTYGASGRTVAPQRTAVQPLALSRSL
jgi:hypothetical protein